MVDEDGLIVFVPEESPAVLAGELEQVEKHDKPIEMAMFFIALFLVCIGGIGLNAIAGSATANLKPEPAIPVVSSSNPLLTGSTVGIPESIRVILQDAKTPNWTDRMPWVVALLIGVMTIVANLITSHFLGKRGKEQSERQLKSAERMNENQIKATILSANRQKWINELREKMTEFRTVAGRLHLNLDQKHTGEKLKNEDKVKYEARVEELYHHLRMMMKPEELLTDSEEDKNTREFLALIDTARGICGLGNSREEELVQIELIGRSLEDLIACSRRMGKNEWEKVKSLK